MNPTTLVQTCLILGARREEARDLCRTTIETTIEPLKNRVGIAAVATAAAQEVAV